MIKDNKSNYRWYVLILGMLTNIFVTAMPIMSLPVLFAEISQELSLTLVQTGMVWSMGSLSAVCMVLVGGLLGDRFGAKRTITTLCFLSGLAGALRGLSGGFTSLAITMFLFGLLNAGITVNTHKVASTWFPKQLLGLANGVLALGMGLGFTAGAMISATVFSPLLGGWRNVLYLYGAISIGISILWLLVYSEPDQIKLSVRDTTVIPLRHSLSRVIRIKGLWFIGLIMMGRMAANQGMTGYLPLYLRARGWMAAHADGALAVSNLSSMLAAIPMALISDKLGSRKPILIIATIISAIGVALLATVDGIMVWISAILASITRDGFMAIIITMITETAGVGVTYTGTALGLAMTLSRAGGIISPPAGNSLAGINPQLPFLFWASLGFLALFGFFPVKEISSKQA